MLYEAYNEAYRKISLRHTLGTKLRARDEHADEDKHLSVLDVIFPEERDAENEHVLMEMTWSSRRAAGTVAA
jgi:hypothetical protein